MNRAALNRAALNRAAPIAVALLLAGCGGGGAGAARTSKTTTLTVLAAASLTESFTRIGTDFEAANPGVRVTFSFGGSATLAQQITAGAPADVFASASPATMKQVTDAGLGAPKGNPKQVKGLKDLPRAKVALCAEAVPCGAAAKKALDAAGTKLTPVTLEQDVKAALSKVRLGEVDAALVYRTDARAASSDVDGVEFPESARAVNDYPIVALSRSGSAEAFVEYVTSEKAQAVLTAAGFQTP